MHHPIRFQVGDLTLIIVCDPDGRAGIVHFGADCPPEALPPVHARHHLHQVRGSQQECGWTYECAAGDRHDQSLPGLDLRYQQHEIRSTPQGRELRITSSGDGLTVCAVFAAYDDASCLRCWQEVRNDSDRPRLLTRVDSLFLADIAGDQRDAVRIHRATNSWCGELQWQQLDCATAGVPAWREYGTATCQVGNVGTWSSKRWLPMGAVEDGARGHCLLWQVESGGSWQWEIGDAARHLYLAAGGADEASGQWWVELAPGESYRSVPVAVAAALGGFSDALRAMNAYRRALRRPSWDNEQLPVIFNDYMNCLFADPTTERERPLIAAAAAAGCEVFVIDAGWYAEQGTGWWSTVGAWEPQNSRFPDGLPALLHEIRDAGMIPGIWLELEVMGVDCPLAPTWPEACFFRRHGRPAVSRGRYQLDFRHPQVRAHADAVVDRLVRDWGVGYIKMDYNIDAGPGTEVDAMSPGAGLEAHIDAYHAWLDAVFARYPDLIIENCSSGGLRMDWAKLARHSLQSTSDNEDYRQYARIAPALATGAPPEMQAVWSTPKRDFGLEDVCFTMCNALLGRVHLSGQLADLDPEHFEAVQQAIAIYKDLRQDLRFAHASWPLGLPDFNSRITAVLLSRGTTHYLAVWNIADVGSHLPLQLPWPIAEASCIYPAHGVQPRWSEDRRELLLDLAPAPSARLYRLLEQ